MSTYDGNSLKHVSNANVTTLLHIKLIQKLKYLHILHKTETPYTERQLYDRAGAELWVGLFK